MDVICRCTTTCGRRGSVVAYMVARGDARVSRECLNLGNDIIADAMESQLD